MCKRLTTRYADHHYNLLFNPPQGGCGLTGKEGFKRERSFIMKIALKRSFTDKGPNLFFCKSLAFGGRGGGRGEEVEERKDPFEFSLANIFPCVAGR